ncbi:MAG: hypothetical protein AAGI53_03415 [Planctomycetota bacterium]
MIPDINVPDGRSTSGHPELLWGVFHGRWSLRSSGVLVDFSASLFLEMERDQG